MKREMILKVEKVVYKKGGIVEAEVLHDGEFLTNYRYKLEMELPVKNGKAIYLPLKYDPYHTSFDGKYINLMHGLEKHVVERFIELTWDAIETLAWDDAKSNRGVDYYGDIVYIDDDKDKVLYDADEHER